MDTMRPIYHLCLQDAWQDAAAAGVYEGSDLDRRDGFIHCSTGDQVAETAARYFPGTDLMLLTIDSTQVEGEVKWEENPRGVFPHIYGRVPLMAVTAVEFLRWTGERHDIPFLFD
ncbi:DUF952 domain-containing protein [Caenispirillum salinarum]|nr:DUF952 domain-containing protein [Caenispirillum salinarum]